MLNHHRVLKFNDFPDQKHPLIRAILNHGGNPSAFASALGVHPNKVYNWLNTACSAPPAQYCRQIEKLSNGEISCEELRPDVFGEVLIKEETIQDRFRKCIGMLNCVAADIEYQIEKMTSKSTKKGGK